MYGWLKFDAGCSLDEIDAMTLHDVRRLSDYAKKHPPLRILVQACAHALGFKLPEAQPESPSKYMTAEQLRALIKQTGGRIDG